MDFIIQWMTEHPVYFTVLLGVLVEIGAICQAAYKQIFSHPLSNVPGPWISCITEYRKAFIELVLKKSWHLELQDLHKRYGPVVRVGPNELHFENPQAYHDIYNNSNRWDKDETLYHSFGEDRSSFGYLTYKEAKQRKDVLNKSFSAAAIQSSTPLVIDKVDSLCEVFDKLAKSDKSIDLNWAFRAMTMDIITYLCFGKAVDAIHAEGFKAPILVAMDASLPVFVAFKHFALYKDLIMTCPPKWSKILSPQTAGLVDLQQLLKQQINELSEDPSKVKFLPHDKTIYHSLLDPTSYKNGEAPEEGSLYEEAQALMFGGADTVGNTLMVAVFHLVKNTESLVKLKAELRSVWPDTSTPAPNIRELERLPYLNACIKEALRLNSGVISGLPRVVPEEKEVDIAGTKVPGDTIVSIGSTFVHHNKTIFPDPFVFKPERWLEDPSLDNWLVAFSRGPRSCLGINLAWLELRYTLAAVVRRFDLKLDAGSPDKLVFRECFLPEYLGPHVKAHLTSVTA